MLVRLVDAATGKTEYRWWIGKNKLENMEDSTCFLRIGGDPQERLGSNGRIYQLVFSSTEMMKKNAVSLYKYDMDVYGNGSLYINGEDKECDLAFCVSGINKNVYQYTFFWLRIYFVAVVGITIYFVRKKWFK